jgi:nucleoside-diphosphate-sugar epimerase
MLKKSGLQWTVFLNGCFLDYWAQPHIESYLRPSPFALDIEHKEAAIPGDGNSRITFTYSFDVARFVVASLDLEEWPEQSRIAGDVLTWNEFVLCAEETLGLSPVCFLLGTLATDIAIRLQVQDHL